MSKRMGLRGRSRLAAAWTWGAMALGTVGGLAHAGTLQDTIFAKVAVDGPARAFVRLSLISAHVRTTSRDAEDVTGPVLAKGDFGTYLFTPTFLSSFQVPEVGNAFVGLDAKYDPIDTLATTIEDKYDAQAAQSGCERLRAGLGTPCGIKVKSQSTLGTAAVSLGYFLDPELTWAAEAFLLAAPLHAAVMGDGDNQLRGKKLIDTKLLPPIVTIGRYWGRPGGLRPYAGLAVSYAVFFDTVATPTLNSYQGGSSPGDTTVRIRSSWGLGPMLGLQYDDGGSGWQFGFNVGRIRFQTDTSLTTRNTRFTADSAVLKDYGPLLSSALVAADGIFKGAANRITVIADGSPTGYTAGQVVRVTTAVMCDLARAKNGSNDCNLGTFERRARTTLDNTMFMLSIGHRF